MFVRAIGGAGSGLGEERVVKADLPIASAPYPAIHLAWCEPVAAAVA
jgi:hypothetical protein